jgi:hypothetical protein
MSAQPQAQTHPFNGKLVAGLIAAGLAAFAALLLLVAYGDRIGPVGGARAPALSVGATASTGPARSTAPPICRPTTWWSSRSTSTTVRGTWRGCSSCAANGRRC